MTPLELYHRWVETPTGNEILCVADGKFVEYWTETSAS
jgi:hypothetical protein